MHSGRNIWPLGYNKKFIDYNLRTREAWTEIAALHMRKSDASDTHFTSSSTTPDFTDQITGVTNKI
jgi:hypothetical protein